MSTTDSVLPGATTLPTLLTERLALRWLTPADVPALFEVFSDAQVTRYWSSPPLADSAAADRLLAEIHDLFDKRALFQWGIARRSDDLVVGTCTLAALTPAHHRAELGFALGRRHWGNGYVAETLPALVEFAFETLGLHRLEADVDPRNHPSIRALERLGFQREGYLREHYHMNGEVQDALVYGLLRRDWAEAQRTMAPTAEGPKGQAHNQEARAGVKQPIVGYHQDDEGHWVAELRCGHRQHVRHDPPWQRREWVTTAEGRASRMGVELECMRCDQEPL